MANHAASVGYDTVGYYRIRARWGGAVGACVSPPRLAFAFGFEASGLLVNTTPFGKAAYIMSEGFQFFFGIWAMRILGFEQEAAEILSEFERRFNVTARTGESGRRLGYPSILAWG